MHSSFSSSCVICCVFLSFLPSFFLYFFLSCKPLINVESNTLVLYPIFYITDCTFPNSVFKKGKIAVQNISNMLYLAVQHVWCRNKHSLSIILFWGSIIFVYNSQIRWILNRVEKTVRWTRKNRQNYCALIEYTRGNKPYFTKKFVVFF